MASDEEETIEQAAAARRERLKALRAAQQLLENPEDDGAHANEKADDENGVEDEENDVSVKFRNYLPHDKQLQEGKLAPPQLPKFEDPVATTETPVEEKKEDPFLNIAPKKPNWDLRRDVQKKLDKLDKRTQKAIFQLMEQQEKEKQLAEEDGGADDPEN
ncbi:hypothetical protein OSB04_028613 [Centaurea solstitialis]|uniref:Coiled-coil domain-containing protein 12 n=1 Tax=Centaurea solstitialis TaxID=347529 RepID=A0AA38VXX7_9ASTR|nr:hypothetical protein OSB04_028613 [Centaurea solstitialis]